MWQNFKHIMKELQGAIIIASAFQAILGYSGLMSVLLRYDFYFHSSPSWNFSIYFYMFVIMFPTYKSMNSGSLRR